MSDDHLEQAIGFVRIGQMDQARTLLEQILKSDRSNSEAWHWYAQTWSTTKERIRVWEACLRFNPTSKQAQDALKDLQPARGVSQATVPVAVEQKRPVKRSSQFGVWAGLVVAAIVAVAGILFIMNAIPKNATDYRHIQPVEFYLYAPKNYSNDRDWNLFVGIHGSGGSGLDCWNMWQTYADKEGFILLCPTIPGDAYGFYQDVGENTVWSAVNEVRKEYRIRDRMFFAGFSAGAFFIQGFTYHYPQAVSGLAILSAGSYLDPGMFPNIIPIAVVIGGSDNPGAVQTSQLFVNDLSQYGFDVQYEILPGVGHTLTNKGRQMTIEAYQATVKK